MYQRLSTAPLISFCLVILASCSSHHPRLELAGPSIQSEIHAIQESYTEALKRGKADEVSSFYTPDAIHSFAGTYRGLVNIEKAWTGWFLERQWEGAKFTPYDLRICGDMLLESGQLHQRLRHNETGKQNYMWLYYVAEWKRLPNQGWRIHKLVISSPITSAWN